MKMARNLPKLVSASMSGVETDMMHHVIAVS